jgi:hypothetical protein
MMSAMTTVADIHLSALRALIPDPRHRRKRIEDGGVVKRGRM